ncbi:MAG: hypothetical protein AB7I32_01925 [Gammaproteobacteria bacterium]
MKRALARLAASCLLGLIAAAPSVAKETIGLCLADDMRERLHAEMRTLLGALHGVHAALAQRDFEALTERAAGAGSALAEQVEKHAANHHAGLPHQFVKLGRSTHAAFDDLATLARDGGQEGELLPALSKLSGHCVECHAKYRLVPAAECATEEAGAH